VIFPSVALAGVSDYKKGVQDGIKIGITFEREKLKQQLSAIKDTALEALNYKYYFLKGEVPPPLLRTRLVEKEGKNGFTVLSTETEVLPPAFFPVSLFQDLRKTYFNSDVVVIPSGYAVVLNTKELPTEKIAYYRWLASTAGYNPVYDYSADRLFFSVREREADAEADVKTLSGMGIPEVEVAYLKKSITVETPKIKDDLPEEIRKTAEVILEKEKQVAGVKVNTKAGLTEVITNLQKALAAVQALDPQRYDHLNLYQLERDLEDILSTLGEAIALQEKYDSVMVVVPKKQEKKTSAANSRKAKTGGDTVIRRLKEIEEMLK